MPVVRSKPQNRNGTELEIRTGRSEGGASEQLVERGRCRRHVPARGPACRLGLASRSPAASQVSDRVITEFPAALSMKLRNGQIEAIYPARRASDVLGAAETLAVSSTTRTAYPCASSSFATLLPPKTGASFAHTNGTNIGLLPV